MCVGVCRGMHGCVWVYMCTAYMVGGRGYVGFVGGVFTRCVYQWVSWMGIVMFVIHFTYNNTNPPPHHTYTHSPTHPPHTATRIGSLTVCIRPPRHCPTTSSPPTTAAPHHDTQSTHHHHKHHHSQRCKATAQGVY